MKLFRHLPILFLVCFVFSINGQTKAKRSVIKTKACKSNNISFPCPKGFVVKNIDKSNSVFVALNSRKKVGIYAFNPTNNLSEQSLIDETLKIALQNLYQTDYKDYEWKDSGDYSGNYSWSKYETAKFARAGFNKSKQQTIHVQFVRLSFNQKDILAGFVYEMENGKNSEQAYKEWFGGGNGDASDALQDLIVKITGETKTDETPGGPPPVKKN